MKIVVCIKQIPDTNDVKWTKDNNLMREGTISVLNPLDETAVLNAVKIKKQIESCEIILLTMGPNNAVESLKYGLALGADRAILLTDKKFAGSDTYATAKTLCHAIKNVIKDFNLIITGQFAQDGDTAQTPYSLANFLNIPSFGYVSEINNTDENEITVTSIKDNGIYKIKSKLPALIALSKLEKESYKPLVKDYMRAQDTKIETYDAEDILINLDETGIKASPTYVNKAFRPENKRDCKFIEIENLIEEMRI